MLVVKASNELRIPFSRRRIAMSIIGVLLAPVAAAQIATVSEAAARTADVQSSEIGMSGGLSNVAVGLNKDSHLHGQISHVLGESSIDAWLAQGWVSNRAGGLRLDYNWIPELDGRADAERFVRKAFVAMDRNADDDRKFDPWCGHGF